MTKTIFDKTDKGRDEIATRAHRLAPRLRTLLVLVDGKQSDDELLKKVSGIGLNEESITELLNGGFIKQTSIVDTGIPAAAPTASPQTTEPASNTEPVPQEGQNQFLEIYHFYTETIKSAIGLRGYALQLKVEKAASVDEFRALRQPYLDAVLKAKGLEMELSLRLRLDQLLHPAENLSTNTTIIGSDAAPSK